MTQEISITAAFFAGFLSFFAPCILPLIPPYFAWLLGVSEDELKEKGLRIKIFIHGLLLILGFSIIFVILGASASKLGQVLLGNRLLVQRIGGLVIILFGLEFIGFLKVFKDRKIGLIKKLFSRFSRKTSSFLVGAAFAFAWVACFSPILGSILVLSSFQGTMDKGVLLLSFYSLGLAVPFIMASLFLGSVIKRIKNFAKIIKWINLFSGLTLVFLGALLFTDKFYKIVMWLSKLI